MTINAIENLSSPTSGAQKNALQQEEALRRAAVQFESLLLMQLTSVLNGSNGDDEDALFGGDGGSDLAKKMFSEQLATTMAESGGVGMSDVILRQFGAAPTKNQPLEDKLANVIAAVRDIKSNSVSQNNANQSQVNKNSRIASVNQTFSSDLNQAEIVSRFDEQYKNYNVAQISETNNQIISQVGNSPFMPDLDAPESFVSPNASVSTKNSAKIKFEMPANSRISSEFGSRFHPIDKKIKFHDGIDIAAPKGTPIGAAADGVVTFAGWSKGYGNLVIIRHADGRETRYGHTEKLFVKEGEQIVAGQQIATVGSTGKSTGPHLHFEVRENDQPINPRGFLSNVLRN